MQARESTTVTTSDAGPRFQVGGGVLETIFKVTGEQTGGTVAVAEHVLQPKQLGAPFHTHHREHEISYVLEGTITVQIGDEIFDADPRTTVLKPKGVRHAFWNSCDERARFVEVFSPAGFEHYFEELEPLIPADGPPDIESLGALWARYELDMDMGSMFELIERHGLTMPGA